MNQADSEKVNMVLLQSEDRVFWILREIKNRDSENWKSTITGITGCMVRKTGIAKKYIPEEYLSPHKKRKTAKKIDYISTENEIFNYEDKLFPRANNLDFTFRIEETKYLPHILTQILWKKIGQEDKFDDYLKQVQQRENPFSANIIIQTGCDNYCSFCIVPFTRGGEVSRPSDEIITECQNAASGWAKEVTLLGQNVNSYGKQKNLKLWNSEKSKWDNEERKLKIGIDLDDTLFIVLSQELINSYNKKYHKILKLDDIVRFDCNGIPELMAEYHDFETRHKLDMQMHTGGEQVLKNLKKEWHSLFIITSRPSEVRPSTEKLLENYFWANFFEEIFFIKDLWHDNKYEAANHYKLDIVVDDGPHHIKAYYENFHGKICIFEQWWNRAIREDNSKVFRIYDWEDFEELLPRLKFTSPFRQLLEDINQIEWIDRIRFTSSNPHDMTRDILDAHIDLKNTCNYLHFALQSWSNEMLKKMNRRHTYEDFRDMVQYLRLRDPLFSISTDIIVGFSGETEEMFEQTVQAFRECEFDFCYTARYSVRPNTLAAKIMPDDIPDNIKAERWHILNSLLLENVTKRNTLMLWRIEEILISGEKDNYFYGRTRNFKEVFFEKDQNYKIWDLVYIKITELDKYVLKGEYI